MGSIVGYFVLKSRKIGAFIIGGWLGYILSLVLYSAFLYKIKTNPPELGMYVTNGVMVLIIGSLSVLLFDYIIIFSTSLCGCYGAAFAVGMYAGDFPNLYTIGR